MTKKTTSKKGIPLNIIFIVLFTLFLIIITIIHSCSKSKKFDISKYKKESNEIMNNENIETISKNSTNSLTEYYIKQQTYAGTCEECFDEIFDYCKVDDRVALRSMEEKGRMKILYKGQKVYLLDSGYTYAIVREDGATEKLWVVSEHIEKDK